MISYRFKTQYPNKKAESVKDLLKELLVPRKWRHYLRIEKEIKINGKYRNFNEQVYPNEQIDIKLTHVESKQNQYLASSQSPDVIYEDSNILIINKPAGQKTHPNLCEKNTALNDCAYYLKQQPYIVHRLDMLTSGLLLVAKNPAVVPILNRELNSKTFYREYLAKVKLSPNLKQRATINLPIGQDPTDQRKRKVLSGGQRAVTHYQIIQKSVDNTALVKVKLETGRTHQIRVHFAAIGSPIIGDPLYNPEYRRGQQLQLQARKISLLAPFSFERINVTLPDNKINIRI